MFDASVHFSTGVSLNDILLIRPTVHSSLIDVLLRIALTADVSRMYCEVFLDAADDLHHFVRRSSLSEPLCDFHMTQVTFGVAALSYAAYMVVKQNAFDLAFQYPLAAKVVDQFFHVDDALTQLKKAVNFQQQLQ